MNVPTNDILRRLEEVVGRGDFVVPPYPAAAMRLRSLIESGKFGLAQVADAASADPALATSLLRIANSSLYRGDGPPFTTLLRAVNRLGARSVSSLALAAGVGAAACAPGPLADVKFRVWRRSVTCALAAQKFAPGRGIDAEEAFLAGLLHGFGRSVGVTCLEQLLPKLPEKRSVLEWLELVEPYRAKLAERVAQLWQLPEAIAAAVSAGPQVATPSNALVAFGDQVAGALDRGASAAELSKVPGLAAAEMSILESFVTGLPSALEALVEAPDSNKKSRATSAVSKPRSALNGELRVLTTPVVDLRKRQEPERLDSVALTPLGLVLTSNRPMQESCVARLALQTTPLPHEGWFNVVLCAPESKRFRIELQAFAPSSELREVMNQLWTKAAKLPPS
jgi:HD-like signal output (HDOD) protein